MDGAMEMMEETERWNDGGNRWSDGIDGVIEQMEQLNDEWSDESNEVTNNNKYCNNKINTNTTYNNNDNYNNNDQSNFCIVF